MTQQQINWAKDHDWFLMDLGNGSVKVQDNYTEVDAQGVTNLVEQTAVFDSFTDLRDWAGY